MRMKSKTGPGPASVHLDVSGVEQPYIVPFIGAYSLGFGLSGECLNC